MSYKPYSQERKRFDSSQSNASVSSALSDKFRAAETVLDSDGSSQASRQSFDSGRPGLRSSHINQDVDFPVNHSEERRVSRCLSDEDEETAVKQTFNHIRYDNASGESKENKRFNLIDASAINSGIAHAQSAPVRCQCTKKKSKTFGENCTLNEKRKTEIELEKKVEKQQKFIDHLLKNDRTNTRTQTPGHLVIDSSLRETSPASVVPVRENNHRISETQRFQTNRPIFADTFSKKEIFTYNGEHSRRVNQRRSRFLDNLSLNDEENQSLIEPYLSNSNLISSSSGYEDAREFEERLNLCGNITRTNADTQSQRSSFNISSLRETPTFRVVPQKGTNHGILETQRFRTNRQSAFPYEDILTYNEAHRRRVIPLRNRSLDCLLNDKDNQSFIVPFIPNSYRTSSSADYEELRELPENPGGNINRIDSTLCKYNFRKLFYLLLAFNTLVMLSGLSLLVDGIGKKQDNGICLECQDLTILGTEMPSFHKKNGQCCLQSIQQLFELFANIFTERDSRIMAEVKQDNQRRDAAIVTLQNFVFNTSFNGSVGGLILGSLYEKNSKLINTLLTRKRSAVHLSGEGRYQHIEWNQEFPKRHVNNRGRLRLHDNMIQVENGGVYFVYSCIRFEAGICNKQAIRYEILIGHGKRESKVASVQHSCVNGTSTERDLTLQQVVNIPVDKKQDSSSLHIKIHSNHDLVSKNHRHFFGLFEI